MFLSIKTRNSNIIRSRTYSVFDTTYTEFICNATICGISLNSALLKAALTELELDNINYTYLSYVL